MQKTFPTLYKRDNESKIQQWTLELDGGRYRVIHGEHNGKLVTSKWTDAEVKNAGRANETSIEKQAEKEALSKIREKHEKGYTEDIEQIDNTKFESPMLAKSFDDYGDELVWPVFSQPKLDGIRCQITSKGMFTRNGKPITSCPHIQAAFKDFFSLEVHADVIFDGELYNHELKHNFNRICELVKRQKTTPETLKDASDLVQFWCYDVIGFSDRPFFKRTVELKKVLKDINNASIIYVETKRIEHKEHLDEEYGRYVELGYEGQMVRTADALYQHKRTKDLLKRKEFQDGEWEILGVFEGTGNRSGTAGYMTFVTKDGIPFKSNIKGPFEWLTKLLAEADNLIGKKATIKYFNLTPDGVPRFPYVTSIRDYE